MKKGKITTTLPKRCGGDSKQTELLGEHWGWQASGCKVKESGMKSSAGVRLELSPAAPVKTDLLQIAFSFSFHVVLFFFLSFPFDALFKQGSLPYGNSQLHQLVVASYLPHKTKLVTPNIWRQQAEEVVSSFKQEFTFIVLVIQPQFTHLLRHNQNGKFESFTRSASVQE